MWALDEIRLQIMLLRIPSMSIADLETDEENDETKTIYTSFESRSSFSLSSVFRVSIDDGQTIVV